MQFQTASPEISAGLGKKNKKGTAASALGLRKFLQYRQYFLMRSRYRSETNSAGDLPQGEIRWENQREQDQDGSRRNVRDFMLRIEREQDFQKPPTDKGHALDRQGR